MCILCNGSTRSFLCGCVCTEYVCSKVIYSVCLFVSLSVSKTVWNSLNMSLTALGTHVHCIYVYIYFQRTCGQRRSYFTSWSGTSMWLSLSLDFHINIPHSTHHNYLCCAYTTHTIVCHEVYTCTYSLKHWAIYCLSFIQNVYIFTLPCRCSRAGQLYQSSTASHFSSPTH